MISNLSAADRESLLPQVAWIRAQGLRFVTLTCLDRGDAWEITYHFDDAGHALTNLRVSLGKARSLPSIAGIFPPAFLVENEIRDLFGVRVEGIPLDFGGRLLLAEGAPDSPQGTPGPQPSATPFTGKE